ncbi:hypothetical protein Tco_0804454 [Tanacetum coccineum]|uniref:UBN2 domain-containing protein n=1 Tax=Tanacetum coccineum TaxID=301880 RepID=A0ABQ5A786_9ASTR
MAPEFWCQTTPTEFWCHGISGAKLHFADVAPLLEFGTKSLAPRLPVLLELSSFLVLVVWCDFTFGPKFKKGNSQVKNNKIDLLVQQYEQFTILEEESIDSSFARFNTIITSLKALDEESKDLSSLALDEFIENLKVHEVVIEKDSEIYKGKKERVKTIALKAKNESSDNETSTSGSDDEEYAMAVRNFRRKGKLVRQPREEKKSFRQRDEKKGKSDRKCFR